MPTATVKSGDRPVPLEYAYSEIPLAQMLEKRVSEDRAPVYAVPEAHAGSLLSSLGANRLNPNS